MVREVSYLGQNGRREFLESARLRMGTINGQELLYNDARAILAGVIRSERPEEELLAWADAFNRVDALAEAGAVAATVERDAYPDACYKTSVRFRTLTHLLRDQALFSTVYPPEDVLRMPFMSRIVSWLRGVDGGSLAQMRKQFNLPEVRLRTFINILSQCRLIDWREEGGEIIVSLTEAGRRHAIEL